MRHSLQEPADHDIFFGPDPELALVRESLDAWMEVNLCCGEYDCDCNWIEELEEEHG